MRSALSLSSVLAAIAVALTLSACNFFAPYRIDVRQGNYVDDAMLAQLQTGMTREQVRFVLGTPLVADVFHSERWDYVHRFRSGRSGKVEQRAISVFFVNDKLARVEGDTSPPDGKEVTEPRARIIEVPAKK
jgi:outer membrane protein assembly factor BamE